MDWVLGVRLVTANESMRIMQVYPSSPPARAGLRAEDRIQRVDRERPRSNARLVKLLRAVFERNGTTVLQVNRQGTLYKFEIPMAAR
ncbi:PDZ domain-containing protein [Planctomycetaceae bacterium SH139]